MNLIKNVAIFFICLLFTSCAVYTIKQSEALSKSIYHANDSFDKGRFDLVDTSLNEATRLAKPPKERIPVDEIIIQPKTNQDISPNVLGSNAEKITTGERTIIIPERFKGINVVVVNSDEYMDLLKDKRIHIQLKNDHENLIKLKQEVDSELINISENSEKLVNANNSLMTEIQKKNYSILRAHIITTILVLIIVGGIYLRIKGIL